MLTALHPRADTHLISLDSAQMCILTEYFRKNVHPAWQATWEKAEYFTGHTQNAAFLWYGQSASTITDTITAPSIISLTRITCWTPSFIYNDVCATCWYPFALCERTTHQNTTMPCTFTRQTSHRCPSLFCIKTRISNDSTTLILSWWLKHTLYLKVCSFYRWGHLWFCLSSPCPHIYVFQKCALKLKGISFLKNEGSSHSDN